MTNTSCDFGDVSCYAGWMQDEVKGFFVWVSEQIFNAITAVFAAIPVPDWALSGADILSQIPSGVGYFVGPFDLAYGLSVVGSAYGIRFLIRRIPLIG